jgi:hypothetical protein
MIVHPHIPKWPVVRKAMIPASLHAEFVRNLADIGVNRATLFPAEGFDAQGLETFVRSLMSYLQQRVECEKNRAIEGIKELVRKRSIHV